MMRYISPKDHMLAQKYSLGTPTRKYRFDTPRPGSLAFHSLTQPVHILLLLLLALMGIGVGLEMDLSTTFNAGVGWLWIWLLAAVSIPVLLSLVLYQLKFRRLASLNLWCLLLSFFVVTILRSIFSAHNLLSDPLAFILAGLFIFACGMLVLWSAIHTMLLPRCIIVCTDGCLVLPNLFRPFPLHWDRITAVWNNGRNTKVVGDDGARLTINYQWPGAKALRDLVYGKAFRHIRARAMSSYEANEPVVFGKFIVTQQGISNGSQQFPWHTIRECEYMDTGVALIGKDNACLDVASLSVLPNAAVFVALVNSISEIRSPS